MSSLRRNIAANFAGKVWLAVLGLLFPPIYARLLGIESYGLVGVYSSLASVLSLLDLGLSATLNREMARYSVDQDEHSRRAMRDLARTMELVFIAAGAAAGTAIVVLAPLISHHWVNARRVPSDVITVSIRLMGIVFALQWPAGIYNGGLLGLQKQVTANVIQATFLLTRFAGAAAILWLITPSIRAFFVWQAIAMAGQTVVTRVALSKSLPGHPGEGTFRWDVLVRNWRFSTGLSLISVLGIVIGQTDKIIVSKLLSLEQFGYYTLAWTVGGALVVLSSPVFLAVFPRLSQLAKQDNIKELSRLYHANCQLVSVLVLPAAAILALFSRDVLRAWSGDPQLVATASGVVVVAAIGTALNALVTVPCALQFAFGWTRLAAVTNLIAVPVLVPLVYWLTKHHGMVGAAAGFAVLNACYVVVMVQVMHMRLLRGEKWRWYRIDVGLPLLGVVAAVLPVRVLSHPPGGRLAVCVYLLAIGIAAVTMAAAMAPEIRLRGLTLLARLRSPRQTT
jgi:O-antigen/teichoic acid export membrane protein